MAGERRLTPGQVRAKHAEEFLAFWRAYPRHAAERAAEQTFADLVEYKGLDPILLINKAKSFARTVDPARLEFVPYPHKWLQNGQYDDVDLFTDAREQERAWFDRCYQDADVAAVENKLHTKMPYVTPPDGMEDPTTIRQWYKGKARDWILTQKDRAEDE